MSKTPIDAEMIVRKVMDEHPETIAVFVRRRMQCPGCIMSPFMTVGEAAESYRVDTRELVAELRDAVATRQPGESA